MPCFNQLSDNIDQQTQAKIKEIDQNILNLENKIQKLNREKEALLLNAASHDHPHNHQEKTLSSSPPSNQSIIVKSIPFKITEEELIRYASNTSEKNSKGGFLGKGKIEEKPVGWEKFYYPYYDVEIEVTVKDTEKRGWFKKEQVTKTIRGRIGLDGQTGAIADVNPQGMSYQYAFLKDLDADEVKLLYWVGSGTFTTADLRGIGQSDAKSRRIADGLASKGILRRQSTRPIQYTTKYPYPYNPDKFVSLMEQYNATESTVDDRVILPHFSENVITSYFDKYWDKCNYTSSDIVYYPYYGVMYSREDHTRFEVIDAVTGLRQEYLEKFVSVTPTKKFPN